MSDRDRKRLFNLSKNDIASFYLSQVPVVVLDE